jgi:hypothetical protein
MTSTSRAGRGAVAVDGVHELSDVADVRARYLRPGPHLTVVMPVARPGEPGDDLRLRWHATTTALRHRGADETLIGIADAAVGALEHRGRDVLLTADHRDAGFCWLAEGASEPCTRVGPHPMLAPALLEVHERIPIVGVVVDRIGADLLTFRGLESRPSGTVEGEEEFVHRAAPGGWSQARWQRHSELVWERNAALVTSRAADGARELGTPLVVVTGDERAVGFVAAHAAHLEGVELHVVSAGGRQEPGTPGRLHGAALDVWRARRDAGVERQLAELREGLGREVLAAAGIDDTRRPVDEGRVERLFVDVTVATAPAVDELVAGALAGGATVIPVRDAGLPDGVAALLRFPLE